MGSPASEFLPSATWAMLTIIFTVASAMAATICRTICNSATALASMHNTLAHLCAYIQTSLFCTGRYQYPFTGYRELADGACWAMFDWQQPHLEYHRRQENLKYRAQYPARYYFHWCFENYIYVPMSDMP